MKHAYETCVCSMLLQTCSSRQLKSLATTTTAAATTTAATTTAATTITTTTKRGVFFYNSNPLNYGVICRQSNKKIPRYLLLKYILQLFKLGKRKLSPVGPSAIAFGLLVKGSRVRKTPTNCQAVEFERIETISANEPTLHNFHT
jgi:hypothetical protein